ncbi:ebrA repressor [Streptomyces daqingensis]|uniref:EbrA repressor n=1 Tax=Streptomyces daqingensis TaxID=1472640 RepID=A0ABQ2MGP7_9ACTN|nr:TetR family transcriptional regulator [Streptomyces daqingensis]GGO51570.1 ebrA repressor [Streptomyces daqingensis]
MAVRRFDPGRRQRIIDAAIRIAEFKGIAGLSHRTVAAEADVPLGSTTYHFASLDDLLVAALEQVTREPSSAMTDWEDVLAEVGRPAPAHGAGPQATEGRGLTLADALTRLLDEYAHGGRGRIRLEYELYLAALRRPALQPVAAAWCDEMARILARHTADEATARVLVALIDGLLLQLLLTDRPFDRQAVRSALARVTGEP